MIMKRVLLTILLLLIPAPVSAQPALLPACIHSGNCGICDIVDIIGNVTQWMFYILGGALLIVIIAGIGWFWILRQMGDAGKIQEGKDVLKGCMWGAFFVLLAWQLVNVILFGFGTQVGYKLYEDPNTLEVPAGSRQKTFKLFGNPWNYICDPGYGDLKKLAGETAAGWNQAVCFSRGDGTPCDYGIGDKDGKLVEKIPYGGICLQGVCSQDTRYADACEYLALTYQEYFGNGGARATLEPYRCWTKDQIKNRNQEQSIKDRKLFYDCLSDTNLCPRNSGSEDLFCCGPVQGEGEPY